MCRMMPGKSLTDPHCCDPLLTEHRATNSSDTGFRTDCPNAVAPFAESGMAGEIGPTRLDSGEHKREEALAISLPHLGNVLSDRH